MEVTAGVTIVRVPGRFGAMKGSAWPILADDFGSLANRRRICKDQKLSTGESRQDPMFLTRLDGISRGSG
jgi:hypothetical protein